MIKQMKDIFPLRFNINATRTLSSDFDFFKTYCTGLPLSSIFDLEDLDYEYIRSRYNKSIVFDEDFIESLSSDYDFKSTVLAIYKSSIFRSCINAYGEKWSRLFNAMFADYDIFNNYTYTSTTKSSTNITKSGSNSDNIDETIKKSIVDTKTTNKIDTPNLVEKTEGNGTDTNSIIPYNSSAYFNTDSSKQIATNTKSTTGTTTAVINDSVNSTDDTSNTKTLTGSASVITHGDLDDNQQVNESSGKTSVLTNAEVIEKEFQLRKRNFISMLFRDIDKYCVLSIYE